MALAAVAADLWFAYVFAVGGTLPLFGDVGPSIGAAIVWLMFGSPILLTIGYWIAILVVVPFEALRLRARDGRDTG